MLTSLFLISALLNFNVPYETVQVSSDPFIECADQGVVFRSTQKLRSNDGRELYFYTNGICEGYDGDYCEFACKYTLMSGEVRLLDENGRTVYKGSYRMKSDRRNLSNVTIAGTTYWAK